MNKVYTYFSDYRLPTEYPFRAALKLYWQRVKVICIGVSLMMGAALLVVLAIVAIQVGYWYVVVIIVLIVLSGFGNGGGNAPTGGSPPNQPNNTGTTKQMEKQQPTQVDKEKVLVPVSRPRRRVKMLAIDPYDKTKPPIVIEVDEED
jgi:hypothetical protein